MNSEKTLRTFFALSLEESLRDFEPFYKKITRQYDHYPLRWSLPLNLHVTLKFMAHLPESAVEPLLETTKIALNSIKPFEISFKKIYLFPSEANPKVIALDVHPQGPLMVLSYTIEQCLKKLGLPVDERPFRPHMTLARFKNPHPLKLKELAKKFDKTIPANKVILYESSPGEESSHYKKLATLTLGDTPNSAST